MWEDAHPSDETYRRKSASERWSGSCGRMRIPVTRLFGEVRLRKYFWLRRDFYCVGRVRECVCAWGGASSLVAPQWDISAQLWQRVRECVCAGWSGARSDCVRRAKCACRRCRRRLRVELPHVRLPIERARGARASANVCAQRWIGGVSARFASESISGSAETVGEVRLRKYFWLRRDFYCVGRVRECVCAWGGASSLVAPQWDISAQLWQRVRECVCAGWSGARSDCVRRAKCACRRCRRRLRVELPHVRLPIERARGARASANVCAQRWIGGASCGVAE